MVDLLFRFPSPANMHFRRLDLRAKVAVFSISLRIIGLLSKPSNDLNTSFCVWSSAFTLRYPLINSYFTKPFLYVAYKEEPKHAIDEDIRTASTEDVSDSQDILCSDGEYFSTQQRASWDIRSQRVDTGQDSTSWGHQAGNPYHAERSELAQFSAEAHPRTCKGHLAHESTSFRLLCKRIIDINCWFFSFWQN